MNFDELKECYLEVLRNYAVFDGRARRKEYWMFVLANIIIGVIAGFIAGILGSFLGMIVNIMVVLYTLAILIPSIAVGVRRLHDTGRSGWWILIGLIPLIGAIVLIMFTIQDSAPGENEYGPNPKE